MATEKWIAGSGQGLTWGSAISSTSLYGGLVNGNALISDLQIDNSTALDIFCDVSFIGGSITTVLPAYVGLYFYPLLDDGATYGDGRFGTTAAGPPPSTFYRGNFAFPVGAQAITGAVYGIILPPGKGKFLLYNQAGNSLAGASANTLKYRTYNRQVT